MPSSIQLTVPLGDRAYVRNFEAEVDCLAQDELFVHGVMRDHRFEMAHTWRLRIPAYDVLEANASLLSGSSLIDRSICERYSRIAGVKIGHGFSRRVLEATGDASGSQETLLLAIEMARVGQQVYQFPSSLDKQFASRSDDQAEIARIAWLKDRAYMPDLANSCYTYRDESEKLFTTRGVQCGFNSGLTHPRPGDKRVFWRSKQLRIELEDGGALNCESAMQDSIHDIAVHFTIGADGKVSDASSRGLRLPYHGLCEDAQLRTELLNGQELTPQFMKQVGETIGGSSGCTHLFDLTVDCLRLLKLPALPNGPLPNTS
jgi:hypothetical protein